jgi:death on curing protein
MFDIADFLLVAEAVLEVDAARLAHVARIPLAESALVAPFASFAGHDLYDTPIQRAAVLASRVMRNHPLPDGNKRVALVLMRLYLRENGQRLVATPVEIDTVFRAVASRQMTEDALHTWLLAKVESL